MINRFKKISGTAPESANSYFNHISWSRDVLLISVLTELIKLIIFALTLVLSCAPLPPKEASFWELPHPTSNLLVWVLEGRSGCCGNTPREEAVFGEDGYGVDEEDGDWTFVSTRDWYLWLGEEYDLGRARRSWGRALPLSRSWVIDTCHRRDDAGIFMGI